MRVMMVMGSEVSIAGRRWASSGDGCCARVTYGARQRGERRVLLVRVVRMLLMSSLGPSSCGHGKPAYRSKGAIVAVVVILRGALAAST